MNSLNPELVLERSVESRPALSQVVEDIHSAYRAYERNSERAVGSAKELGRLLSFARDQVGSRKFAPWVREHFKFSMTSAYNYMRLHRNVVDLSVKTFTDAVDSGLSQIAGPALPEEAEDVPVSPQAEEPNRNRNSDLDPSPKPESRPTKSGVSGKSQPEPTPKPDSTVIGNRKDLLALFQLLLELVDSVYRNKGIDEKDHSQWKMAHSALMSQIKLLK